MDLKDLFLTDFETCPESERINIHCNISLCAAAYFLDLWRMEVEKRIRGSKAVSKKVFRTVFL